MGKELFNPHLNKFSIRKLNVGVCSVLLSTVFLLGTAATVNADETASGTVDDNISLPEKPTESAVSQSVSLLMKIQQHLLFLKQLTQKQVLIKISW